MEYNALLKMAKYSSKSDKLIAYLIEFHTTRNSISWDDVAGELQITLDQLARLALCNRPRSEQRVGDLKKISKYVDIDINKLGTFITNIESSISFQSSDQNQFLMAARDQDNSSEDE